MAEENPKVNGFLANTIERKRAEVAEARVATGLESLRERVADRGPARPWAEALRRPARGGVRVIAEFKRASPSAGRLAEQEVDPVARGRLYARSGAAAMSVLTDTAFDGRLADLAAVAGAGIPIPLLRKDFLIDPWQVWESRAAGADAGLVLVAALGPDEIDDLASAAHAAGIGLLVEIHAPAELERALAIEPEVVGVNARNLATLEVSVPRMLETIRELRDRAGDELVLVAESGIAGPDEASRAVAAGADAVLVGEHLMRSPDPARSLATLVTAGECEGAAP